MPTPAPPRDPGRPSALLSVDFEDWHQLARRRLGAADWERPGPALRRQTHVLLQLLDEMSARATFFILGVTARAHPDLLEPIVAAGHEIGCHGDHHLPVSGQTPAQFEADLAAARRAIEALTGRAPLGYRAPAFSITRETPWAYEVLAAQGFAYDASRHDTPRIRHRLPPAGAAPHPIGLAGGATLWEFPAAVWRTGKAPVPVGGASYWAVLPRRLVIHGLRHAGELPGLYLHPHEFDPRPLRASADRGTAGLPRRAGALLRAAHRNLARRTAPDTLRLIARSFRLIPYGEAYAGLSHGAAARP
jgi:polysaccharide deacetylase family protein (PEP-CTERM system associated)